MKKLLGWFLLSSPFAAIFVIASKAVGIKLTLMCFGFIATIVLVIFLGVFLICEDKR